MGRIRGSKILSSEFGNSSAKMWKNIVMLAFSLSLVLAVTKGNSFVYNYK